jgi:hypothetical protein
MQKYILVILTCAFLLKVITEGIFTQAQPGKIESGFNMNMDLLYLD